MILKFRHNTNDEGWIDEVEGAESVEFCTYINTEKVLDAYHVYGSNDEIYFTLEGQGNPKIYIDFDDHNIDSLENSNKLTSALVEALNSRPGAGVIDMMSTSVFKELEIKGIDYIEAVSDFEDNLLFFLISFMDMGPFPPAP